MVEEEPVTEEINYKPHDNHVTANISGVKETMKPTTLSKTVATQDKVYSDKQR